MGGMTTRLASSNDFILIGDKSNAKRFMVPPFSSNYYIFKKAGPEGTRSFGSGLYGLLPKAILCFDKLNMSGKVT
jgi:hypothetical protein